MKECIWSPPKDYVQGDRRANERLITENQQKESAPKRKDCSMAKTELEETWNIPERKSDDTINNKNNRNKNKNIDENYPLGHNFKFFSTSIPVSAQIPTILLEPVAQGHVYLSYSLAKLNLPPLRQWNQKSFQGVHNELNVRSYKLH